jgi:hypothetical protein
MNAIPTTGLAIRHTSMLLQKAGLTEDEADRFIDRLTREAAAANLANESERLEFIEQELARLELRQRNDTLKSANLRNLIIGVVGGVAGNYLTRGIDYVAQRTPTIFPPTPRVENQEALETIRIEWAGAQVSSKMPDVADAMYRALKIHEQRDGSINPLTAVDRCLPGRRWYAARPARRSPSGGADAAAGCGTVPECQNTAGIHSCSA